MNTGSMRTASSADAIQPGRTLYAVLPWRRTRRGEIKVLLVTPRDDERWGLPCALPGDAGTARKIAMSEAFEKAGVIGLLDPNPVGSCTGTASQADGSAKPCTVLVYALRVRGTLTHWPGHGRFRRRWHYLSAAAEAVADEGLKRLLASLDMESSVFGQDRKAA